MNQRIRVKICGITRVEDMLAAFAAGADAIGLVFYDKSPRSISIEQAKILTRLCPPFMSKVGLFVNADNDYIQRVINEVSLDILQFHGDETNEQCLAHDKAFIKAIRVKPNIDLTAKIEEYPDTMGILLDTYIPGVEGGTGVKFDWGVIPADLPKPIILAGGLTPDNVAEALSQVQPLAVDVSGGVEHEKGIKNDEKIRAFIKRVNQACNL